MNDDPCRAFGSPVSSLWTSFFPVPFRPLPTETLQTPSGTMAYTDVGSGPPLVCLHGNPTSAVLYRHLLPILRSTHRVVVPDLIGFGRSEAPRDSTYTPAAHATRVELLLRHLGLSDLTLVLHDWGGPIGLSVAVQSPAAIQRLVLTNTWAWPLTHRPLVQAFSRLLSTPPGRFVVERLNGFPRFIMPLTQGPDAPSAPAWRRAYAEALATQPRRHACRMLACSLIGATRWLGALWRRRHRLRNCPVLLCWGMADPAFGTEPTLRRWTALFSTARVHRFGGVGHYLPEELGTTFAEQVASFLRTTA